MGEVETLEGLELELQDMDTGGSVLEFARQRLERIKRLEDVLELHKKLSKAREEDILSSLEYHRNELLSLGCTLKRQYGKARTPLPGGGHVEVRRSRGSFKILDEKAARAWVVKYNHLDALRTKEYLVGSEIRKRLKEADTGELAEDTGEVVDWAKVEGKGQMSVSYSHPTPEQMALMEPSE